MSSASHVWKPRFDLDLIQRCGTVILFSWILTHFLGFLGLYSLKFWIDLGTLVALSFAVCRSSLQLRIDGKSVLITGCDTGFGFKLAQHLHDLGFTVFAGCLQKESGGAGARKLADVSTGRLHVLQLDVTKEEDWDNAASYITKETGGKLWGLINNAGWSTFGEVEWVPLDTYRKIGDINVFGVIRGTQKMLPLIRKCKGRVVTITTPLVRGSTPSRSPYIFTKTAIVGFIECLRYEMKRFGVEVCMIEPGNYLAGTSLFQGEIINATGNEMWSKMKPEVRSAYGEDFFNGRIELMRKYRDFGLKNLDPVIEAYTNALLDVYTQVRYQPTELKFRMRFFIYTHLPEIFFDKIYGYGT